MHASVRRIVVLFVLGALLVPSHGIWARGLRGLRRHTGHAQRRSLRQDRSSDAGDIRCLARPFRAATVPDRSEDPGRTPAVGDEPQFSPTPATVDPSDDDDHRLKKGRRKGPLDINVALPQEPPKLLRSAELLASLRLHLSLGRPQLRKTDEPLVHFGSGPCHSIPRPREGTICLLSRNDGLLG